MSLTVLVLDDDSISRTYIMMLLRRAGFSRIIESGSLQQAVALLDSDFQFDLIVTDFNLGDGTGADFVRRLRQKGLRTPVFMCSSEKKSDHYQLLDLEITGWFQKPFQPDKVLAMLQSYVGLDQHLNDNSYEYVPFKISIAELLTASKSDIYVKLNDKKFSRILKADNTIDRSLLGHYKEKGVTELFIRFDELDSFLLTLEKLLQDRWLKALAEKTTGEAVASMSNDSLKQEIKDFKEKVAHIVRSEAPLDPDFCSQFRLTQESMHLIKSVFAKFGATRDVQRIIQSTASYSALKLSQETSLVECLAMFEEENENNFANRAAILSTVSSLIAFNTGWSSRGTFYKMSVASLLHDLPLILEGVPCEELALGQDPENPIWLSHPAAAAAQVRKFLWAPDDVEVILALHEESPTGKGFPSGIKAHEFPPLAAAFVFAKDLTHHIMGKKDLRHEIDNFYRLNRKSYSEGVFAKIFTANAGFAPQLTKVVVKD